jgi:hypothetical protein
MKILLLFLISFLLSCSSQNFNTRLLVLEYRINYLENKVDSLKQLK